MAKQKGTDLDDYRTGGGKERSKITDKINLLKLPERKWVTLRIRGGIFTYGGYWVTTKKKDGGKTRFYVPAPSYDPESQQLDSTKKDPWRDLMNTESDVEREDRKVQFTRQGFANVLSRAHQDNKPKKVAKPTKAEIKAGFKDKDSETWTPYHPLRMPSSLIGKIRDLKGLNTVEIGEQTKTFPVNHEKYGCDIRVYYDPKKSPAEQYQVQLGKRRKLTDEEKECLLWDLSELEEAEDDKAVAADFASWATRNGVKVGGKSSKKGKSRDDDDDEDEDEDDSDDFDGDDEDDDSSSKKKSKKGGKDTKAAKSKKSRDEDDEDEDEDGEDEEDSDEDDDEDSDDFDDDEDDEDEDEKPSKSKSKKGGTDKKGKKSKSDDDEDEDEDSDDEDEDDDLDEDSDDEDDDDDEEEEKSSKKSKQSGKGKAAAKGKKSKDEDDDEDDDLDDDDDSDSDDDDDSDSDDEDEDEEDSKKSKKAGKGKKGSKSKDDDDFDADFDDADEDEKPAKKSSKKAGKDKKKSK